MFWTYFSIVKYKIFFSSLSFVKKNLTKITTCLLLPTTPLETALFPLQYEVWKGLKMHRTICLHLHLYLVPIKLIAIKSSMNKNNICLLRDRSSVMKNDIDFVYGITIFLHAFSDSRGDKQSFPGSSRVIQSCRGLFLLSQCDICSK